MIERRCLYCYDPLEEGEKDLHPGCSRKFFGTTEPPALAYTNDQMLELAEKVVQSHTTVTGVQPKLSLGLEKISGGTVRQKLTIVGVWGGYILKPPNAFYPNLPELEDLTMHLATLAGIEVVPHTLIRLKSGELAYLTRRIDRKGKRKTHMEDLCQLTGRLTEDKYRGSHEQIGKAIRKYSANPGLDLMQFLEQVVFCFLTGNNDMHLKNFSLIKDAKTGYVLTPAYDLVASSLVVEGDDEELALALNGKRKKLGKKDFEQAGATLSVPGKGLQDMLEKFRETLPVWYEAIRNSFLPNTLKEDYQGLIAERVHRLQMVGRG